MGLILPQEVSVKVVSSSYLHYQNKGYSIPKHTDIKGNKKLNMGEYIKVHVLDLMNVSHIKVKIQCDYCGCIDEVEWVKVFKSINHKNNTKITCHNCNGMKTQEGQRKRILNGTNINPLYWDKEWLNDEYLIKNRSAQDIADECNVGIRKVEKYIKRYELDKKFVPIKERLSKEEFYNLYIIKHMQLEEISITYKSDRTTLTKLLKEYDIPARTHSESMAIYYDERHGRELKSIKNKEIWSRKEFYIKMCKINKENTNKLSRKIKFSASMQGINIKDWNGFITPKNTMIRNGNEYKEWRQAVFERDNYTCQCCGARNGNGVTVYLNSHHKECFADNPELRFDIGNGVTLCSLCHDPRMEGSFHNLYGTLHNTTEQLNEYIEQRQLEMAI